MASKPQSPDLAETDSAEEEQRKVLAQNLFRLMSKRPKLNSNPKIQKASKVGVATLSRILRMESGATLDTITRLAKAFELEPWQLLVPELDPDSPQQLHGAEEAEIYSRMRSVIAAEVAQRSKGITPAEIRRRLPNLMGPPLQDDFDDQDHQGDQRKEEGR